MWAGESRGEGGHVCMDVRKLLNCRVGLSRSHLSGGGELPPPGEGGPAAARRVAPGHHQAVAVVSPGAAAGGRGSLVDVDVHGAEGGAEGVDARQALAPALFAVGEGNFVRSTYDGESDSHG